MKRWFFDDWQRIEPKLRTSIVEGISVFLSLFDDNPDVKRVFCPPKVTYNAEANHNGRFVKFAAARHSIFFKLSIPATPEPYRRFTRIRLNRPSPA